MTENTHSSFCVALPSFLPANLYTKQGGFLPTHRETELRKENTELTELTQD